METDSRRVLVIGWDAADWQVIDPLLAQGKMPNLARLIGRGVRGNIATLHPVLSPMLWSSIATGKRPYKHGVHGFTEPTPDGAAVRPVTSLSRTTKAMWNILGQEGRRSIVVGWWPSHPAEPIRGVMVSNHFHRPTRGRSADPSKARERWAIPRGAVHPEDLAEKLAEYRVHPLELTEEHLRPFAPGLGPGDEDDERVVALAKTLAETASVQACATALMQLEAWDLAAVYFDGIDHFCHGFMRYHPPRRDFVDERSYELFKGVIEGAYRFHDGMLGTLLALAGEETTVILLSDHGFRSDHLRPRSIPAEPAGPAAEHRDFGILVAAGPGIRRGGVVHGASVLDVCPTVLRLFGLPIGRDMDGKPLTGMLEEEAGVVETIASWDEVEGDAGMHPEERRLDAAESAEAMQQLVELGYIEPPSEDTKEAVRECVREQRYNLAQAFMDGGRYADAARTLEGIWEEWPGEHRFGLKLIACYAVLRRLEARGGAIERLAERTARFEEEARRELAELEPELAQYRQEGEDAGEAGGRGEQEFGVKEPGGKQEMPRALRHRVRRLASLASPHDALIEWLRASQAAAMGDPERALRTLSRLEHAEEAGPEYFVQLGETLLNLGALDRAIACFERALASDADHVAAAMGMMRAHARRRSWGGVADWALRATELVYFNPRAHAMLGRALIRLGEIDHAETALKVALSQAPSLRIAHGALAYLYAAHRGDEGAARRHREAARRAQVDALMRRAEAEGDGIGVGVGEAWAAMPLPELDDLPAGFEEGEGVVVVVSGLPRSGTSMVMQMLAAGGVEAFTDAARAADENNPRGYLEHEDVKRRVADAAWVRGARGRALKVVAPLVQQLPRGERYAVVFVRRRMDEVLASQSKMRTRLGADGPERDSSGLRRAFEKTVARSLSALRGRADVRVIEIDHASVLDDPAGAARVLGAFVRGAGGCAAFDEQAAAAVVDAALHRERGG